MRPLIAVTTTLAPAGSHNLPSVRLNVQYVTAVEEPGGTALLLTPVSTSPCATSTMCRTDSGS